MINQSSVFHHEYFISNVLYVRNDMGGKKYDAVFTELPDKVSKAHSFFGIQSGGGFVEDQQLRVVQQMAAVLRESAFAMIRQSCIRR